MESTKLDCFVGHVMHGRTRDAMAIAGPVTNAARATWVINELAWPTLECLEDLHTAGQMPRQTYNAGVRTLRTVVNWAFDGLTASEANGRSALVLTIPGEPEEFGAGLFSRLAELHGWQVHFAGAGLTHEEILFALGRLSIDCIVIHAGLLAMAPAVRSLIAHLRRVGVWPVTQVVVCGRAAERLRHWRGGVQADLLARTPIELLELMHLCPDFRVTRMPMADDALVLLQPEILTFPDIIRRRLEGWMGLGGVN